MPLEAFEALRAVGRCPGGRQAYAGRGRLDPRLRFALALGAGHTVAEVEQMARQVTRTCSRAVCKERERERERESARSAREFRKEQLCRSSQRPQ